MTKPIDWSEVRDLRGSLAGRPIASRDFEGALYAGVRDAFPINEVPREVCDALENAAAHLRAADNAVSALGLSVAFFLSANGKNPDGTTDIPPEPYSEADIAARSSHRPDDL